VCERWVSVCGREGGGRGDVHGLWRIWLFGNVLVRKEREG
jgi:hypothetical protein